MLFPAILAAMLALTSTDTQCEALEAYLSAPSIASLSEWQATISEE